MDIGARECGEAIDELPDYSGATSQHAPTWHTMSGPHRSPSDWRTWLHQPLPSAFMQLSCVHGLPSSHSASCLHGLIHDTGMVMHRPPGTTHSPAVLHRPTPPAHPSPGARWVTRHTLPSSSGMPLHPTVRHRPGGGGQSRHGLISQRLPASAVVSLGACTWVAELSASSCAPMLCGEQEGASAAKATIEESFSMGFWSRNE